MIFASRTLCILTILFCSAVIPPAVFGQEELARRAQWQARFERLPEAGVRVRTLQENSGLARAGIVEGDVLLNINGASITSAAAWDDMTDALVAGREYRIRYRRGTQYGETSAVFDPLPFETHEGITTIYDHIVSDFGIRQRVIITHPEGTASPQPAIFVLQGLSCSSIENWAGRRSNFVRSIQDLINQSGMVVMRTEKPGLGDSEGDCSATDFRTELNGYETALKKLKSLPYVDPERIVVFGSSMGSALAPYFANKYQLNGVISDGTYYRTWFEHMLEIERRIKAMEGNDESTVNGMMNQAYIPLYYGMLIEKMSYQAVVERSPLLADYNYHDGGHMYGRPVSFYHQLQDFDVAGNWHRLAVPARIRWGTSDWIMSEADNDMIVDALQRAGNTNVELLKYPGLDHFDTIQPSMEASFKGESGVWDDRISGQLVEWAKDLNAQKNQRTGVYAETPEESR